MGVIEELKKIEKRVFLIEKQFAELTIATNNRGSIPKAGSENAITIAGKVYNTIKQVAEAVEKNCSKAAAELQLIFKEEHLPAAAGRRLISLHAPRDMDGCANDAYAAIKTVKTSIASCIHTYTNISLIKERLSRQTPIEREQSTQFKRQVELDKKNFTDAAATALFLLRKIVKDMERIQDLAHKEAREELSEIAA